MRAIPIDRNGYFTTPWAHFFQFLYDRVGGSSAPSNSQIATIIAGGSGGAAIPVTPGASPYVYQAAVIGNMVISGGGLKNVEVSRDGVTYYTTGNFRGMFALSGFDFIRVTYTSAPTMTFIPR